MKIFVSRVNALKATSAEEDFSSHMDRRTCSVDARQLLSPATPFSHPLRSLWTGVVAGMEVMHALPFTKANLATATDKCCHFSGLLERSGHMPFFTRPCHHFPVASPDHPARSLLTTYECGSMEGNIWLCLLPSWVNHQVHWMIKIILILEDWISLHQRCPWMSLKGAYFVAGVHFQVTPAFGAGLSVIIVII